MINPCNPKNLKGNGLIIALIFLIIMSMAAIGLVHSISTGVLAAGNFAFRQSALHAADTGSEAAIHWMRNLTDTTLLYSDNPENGYYATYPAGLDITNNSKSRPVILINWDNNNCDDATNVTCIEASPELKEDAAGNSVRYIIHRLCKLTGSPYSSSNNCVQYQGGSGSSPLKGMVQYGQSMRFNTNADIYYRIITRIKGPRNTIVYTQIMFHY